MGEAPTSVAATLDTAAMAALRSSVAGRVVTPADDDYDRARRIFFDGYERRPAAIVRVADVDDVPPVLDVARSTGVPLAIRSGGHSVHAVCDDGIVLDLSGLRALDIAPERRTATAQPGVTAAQYTNAAAAFGLATSFGDTGSVGLGGLVLGGGIGFLVRKHGLTIDDLTAVEMITSSGEQLRVDGCSHADLFWALRGGGGNFGVVTRLHLRLHRVDPIVGGTLILPATPATIAGFLVAADAAPDELSTKVNVMPIPPMPGVAEEHYGRMGLWATMVFAGNIGTAETVYAPFRALATPLADLIRTMPYAQIFEPDDENYHPRAMSRTFFTDELLDEKKAAALLAHLDSSTAMVPVAQLRVLGGAMTQVPEDATAFAHRGRKMMVSVAAVHESPDETDAHRSWVDGIAAELRSPRPGAYVNFLYDDGPARLGEAYPPWTWDRLARIKQRYDPTNLFRVNVNVPPGAAHPGPSDG